MTTYRPALPAPVVRILSRLRENGFSAHPVGGCVRDLLLGRRVHDWDVATSARPEQVQPLFGRVFATGARHGTVTVMDGRTAVEVTTFRAEAAYSDNRRPDSVRFVSALSDDLSRRDFTVNAMALDEAGQVIDLFGGRDDLARRLIRCVGDAQTRFTEDALRMWRAFRFSAALGFSIDRAAWDAIAACAPLAARLSAERVAGEVQRILLSGGAARLADALLLGIFDAFLTARPLAKLPFQRLKGLPHRPDCRWAGFAALLRRAGCLDESASFLRALRLPNQVILPAASGAERALSGPMPTDDADWRRLCHLSGVPGALCAASAADALCAGTIHVPALRRVLREKPCLSVKDLRLSGAQLKQAGFEGRDIGRVQRLLLEHVLEHPEDNDADTLEQLTVDS